MTSEFVLLCLVVCSTGVHNVAAWIHEITISKHGADSPHCIKPMNKSISHCHTLDFVFQQIQNDVLLANSTTVLIEHGSDGTYNLNKVFTFKNLKNFHLAGAPADCDGSQILPHSNVVIRCNRSAGLAFLHSENIMFSFITFENCGSWQNSTSINNPMFQAAIFVAYSRNLTLNVCSISQSPGVGLNLYDVGGDIFIDNVNFTENYAYNSWNFTHLHETARFGGGLHIEFTFCGALYPFDCNEMETERFNHDNRFTIRNSNFISNNATTVNKFNQTFQQRPSGKNFNSVGRGGGISFIIKGNASRNQFRIDNCIFRRNTADWGAGYAVYFQDHASNNSITVTNSRFVQNTARYGGGAMKYAFTIFGTFEGLLAREPNHYFHKNCSFEQNKATEGWGGAFSVFGSTSYLNSKGWNSDQIPVFVNCKWVNNSATAGAAIGALAKPNELWRKTAGHRQQGFGFSLKIVNNNFTNNTIIPTMIDNVTVYGIGTIYTVFAPITLKGDVTFMENHNTALVLDNACVDVDGNVLFYKNTGINGGAVGIYGASALVFQAGAKLMFKENFASSIAGAVYVKTAGPDIASFSETIFQRHQCFFQYFNSSVEPDNWDISVVFRGNNASQHIGRTLFGNTLQFCRFGRPGIFNDAIKSWNTFSFERLDGKRSDDELEVSTEPIKMQVQAEEWRRISPNEQFTPSIKLLDERNHSVPGLIKIVITNKTESRVDIEDGVSPYFFVKDKIDSLWLIGQPHSQFDANIISLHSQSIKMTLVDLTVERCPPGYVYIGVRDTCVCTIVHNNVVGISRCGEDGKTLFLRKGYWGGSNAIQGEGKNCSFLVKQCPYGYCKCARNRKPTHGLINECECLYDSTVNQCVDGRQGILCGECQPGLSVRLGSYECVRCKNGDLLNLIPFFVMLTILVLLVLFLKLDFFSGYLNCWLYTYQIVYLLLPDYFLSQDPFINFVVKLTNIKFVFGKWCIWNGMNDLQKISFGYVVPAYQILILVIFAKLFSKCSICQGSYFRPFSTILLLSYSSIVEGTFKLLRPVSICSEWRVYISANSKYFSGEHIIHASLAIAALLFFIIPFPIMLARSSLFTRHSAKLFRITKPFLDVLKSCYHTERSWYAAYYIICRLLAILLCTFTPDLNTRQKTLQLFCVAVLLFFFYFRPYKSDIIEKIDAFFLSYLVFMSLLAESIVICSFSFSLIYNICFYCIHILLYVPFIYTLILFYYYVRNCLQRRGMERVVMAVNGGNQDVIDEDDRTQYQPLTG